MPVPARCRGRLSWPSVLLGCLPALGCVSYRAAPIDYATLAAATPAPPTDPIDFADAVAFACMHAPELQRLQADAAAAGADTPPLDLQGQWEGSDQQLAAMVDPIALLGLGERGAQRARTAARAAAAVATLAVARWQRLGRIAEVYAALRALDEVAPPPPLPSLAPRLAAGLVSPRAAARASAAAAMAAAEAATRHAERLGLLAELRPLLGIAADATIELTPVDAEFPPLPPTDAGQLHQRPDLVLRLADYEVADAEFRAAVRAQYPSLMLGPEVLLRGGGVDPMAWFRIPLASGGAAAAAQHRRTAARAAAAQAWLEASNQLQTAIVQHAARDQAAQAAAAAATASSTALRDAIRQLDLDPEPAVGESIAELAVMAVRDAGEHRTAAVATARARVQRALAAGWPAAPLAAGPAQAVQP